MASIANAADLTLPQALIANGRSPDIPDPADLYGFLVGAWEIEILHYWVDLRGRGLTGVVHAARVLEGRAVQDVWIIPRTDQANDEVLQGHRSYGTTLRVWDSALQAWRVTWVNPVSGQINHLVGRRRGNDIVQIGTHSDGTPIRWNFTEITPDSFLWTGEALSPDGQTWVLQGQFRAGRIR